MICEMIPERVYQKAMKEYKKETEIDYTCVWPQESDEGIHLHDFGKQIRLSTQDSIDLLTNLLGKLGYSLGGCDAIYYTSSKFLIAVWFDRDAKKL